MSSLLHLPTQAGLEIEVNGVTTLAVAQVIHKVVGGAFVPAAPQEQGAAGQEDTFHIRDPQRRIWKSKPDGTCDAEFNSPPLRTHADLATALHVAEAIRLRTEACVAGNTGMHWHLDMAALSPQQIVYFTALMHRHQPFIYQAFRVFTPRLRHCMPMEGAAMGALLRDTPSDRHALADAFGVGWRDREKFVNLQNLREGGLGTAEVRCFNATLDRVGISAALGLGQRAYQLARRSTQGAPFAWSESINSPDAFAHDFKLAPTDPLVRLMKHEASRPQDWIESVINGPGSFKDLSPEARDNEEVAMAAVCTHGMLLEFVSDRLKRDPRLVRAAVLQDGEALSVADPFFRADFDFVYGLMEHCLDALEFADEALRNNPVIVRRAMCNTSTALEYAGDKILGNFAFMRDAVRSHVTNLFYAKLPAAEFFELARFAVQRNGDALSYIPVPLRNDPTLVLMAVQHKGLALRLAGPHARAVPMIALTAVMDNIEALPYVSPTLMQQPMFLRTLCKRVPAVWDRLTTQQQRAIAS